MKERKRRLDACVTVAKLLSLPCMLATLTRSVARNARTTLRSYATPPVTETTKANASLKRFWRKVELDSSPSGLYTITLDGRPIRTPSNTTMEIPKEKKLLAALIAHEWDIQDKILKTHTLPMVLVSRTQMCCTKSNPDQLGCTSPRCIQWS